MWLHPGQETPIQVHDKKHEHWHVLRGTARITVDGVTTQAPERESVYVPPGATHKIANEGDRVLEVIEMDIDTQIDGDAIAQFMGDQGITGSGR